MIVLILLTGAVVAWVQIASLAKKRYWRELVVFCVFWGIALTLSVSYASGVILPDPMEGVKTLFNALGLSF